MKKILGVTAALFASMLIGNATAGDAPAPKPAPAPAAAPAPAGDMKAAPADAPKKKGRRAARKARG